MWDMGQGRAVGAQVRGVWRNDRGDFNSPVGHRQQNINRKAGTQGLFKVGNGQVSFVPSTIY